MEPVPFDSVEQLFVAFEFLQIYTDWVNRYLTKLNLAPIRDLTYDLREPKQLVNLIHSASKCFQLIVVLLSTRRLLSVFAVSCCCELHAASSANVHWLAVMAAIKFRQWRW